MNVTAFERLIETCERDLYSFCRYLAMDGPTASDLYQETALAAFEMRNRIDPEQNPKSFLFSIAVGKWKNMRRKAARRQSLVPEVSLTQMNAAWHVSDNAYTPENEAIKAAQRECIHQIISAMKDKFRLPLILYYFDDCSTEAISAILKIPAGTVKSRLHKGRTLLKDTLIKEGFNDG